MTEHEFLELNVFHDLKNYNSGYDDDKIWHFDVKDFPIVMERAEEFGVRILGIECWEDEKEKYTKYREDYEHDIWHRTAYKELIDNHSPCTFAATFEIPPLYFKKHILD